MHLFFSGIGGAGIGPLALFAHQAGFKVSGSDKQNSKFIDLLKSQGVTNINIGQTRAQIESVFQETPIDWYIYSSAVTLERPDSEELSFCTKHGIRTSKRDEFISFLLKSKKLEMVAIAGTHGKTTTTAMVVWLFKQLDRPINYLVPAQLSFGEMAQFNPESDLLIYEADEFDHNFLSFEPLISLITGVSWDHHEIFPTREDYQQAFLDFITQSEQTLIWQEDAEYLNTNTSHLTVILDSQDKLIETIGLPGKYNRLDAYLAARAVMKVTGEPIEKLLEILSRFPGLERRMEEIVPGLYSDYAHTPEKIRGAMSVALEMAAKKDQELVVIYEPLTDRRQHYIIDEYRDCFEGAKVVYWLPSYLAREDPDQSVLTPEELISHLFNPSIAQAKQRDDELKEIIDNHIKNGAMVVGMNGGGGGSLDEWLRTNFKASNG